MILGILVKGTNCIFFCNAIDFIFEFIPQLAFMLSTFGYMSLLIIVKWNNDYTADTSKAPSILDVMLKLGLKLGDTDGHELYGEKGF